MTRGQQLVDAIYRSRTEFKKKNVPGIPVCMLPPAEYEHLTNAAGSLDNMAWADANFNGTDVGKITLARLYVYRFSNLLGLVTHTFCPITRKNNIQ